MGIFQFLHGLVNRLLHAESVSALTRRIFVQALQVGGKERGSRSRSPQFLSHELPAYVTPLMGFRIHLLHWIHEQVKQVGHAGIRLGVKPDTIGLDANVHLPAVDPNGHQVSFVVIKDFPARRFFSFSRPQVKVVLAVEMDFVRHIAHLVAGEQLFF